MLIPYILGGIGAIAVGLTVADFFGKHRPRRNIDGRALDIAESRTYSNGYSDMRTAEYFPPPDDGRPQK